MNNCFSIKIISSDLCNVKLVKRNVTIPKNHATSSGGISRQHLAAIEAPNMDRGLSLELLLRIADALEIEPYLLLKFNPEM